MNKQHQMKSFFIRNNTNNNSIKHQYDYSYLRWNNYYLQIQYRKYHHHTHKTIQLLNIDNNRESSAKSISNWVYKYEAYHMYKLFHNEHNVLLPQVKTFSKLLPKQIQEYLHQKQFKQK